MRKNSELLCDSNLPEGTHFKAISLLLFLLISGIILSLFMMLGECLFHQFNQPKIMKKSQNFRKRVQSDSCRRSVGRKSHLGECKNKNQFWVVGQNFRQNSNSGVHPGLTQTNMGSDDQKNLQQNQVKNIQDETFLKAAETGALRYRFSTQQDYQTLNPQICPI